MPYPSGTAVGRIVHFHPETPAHVEEWKCGVWGAALPVGVAQPRLPAGVVTALVADELSRGAAPAIATGRTIRELLEAEGDEGEFLERYCAARDAAKAKEETYRAAHPAGEP